MAFWRNLSLQQLLSGAMATFLRFPLVLLSAFAGTAAAIKRVGVPYEKLQEYVYLDKLMIVSALGLILFLVLELLAQRYKYKRPVLWLAGIVFLGLYYWFLPPELNAKQGLRFFMLALALHLAATFAMYLNTRQENGFWQFSKSLFLRILTSALYTAVLFMGLSLAVLAVEKLFSVTIPAHFYERLWLLLVGVFNTWFFLAGVPADLDELEQNHTYPKGLKVFTQFVLLPLVTLYLIILYVYFGKIVLEWEWPQGWVSVLVLWFSIAGILSLLLIHPIRHEASNTWIRTYSRWFYRALFPLIILLALAIWRRVSEYGVTEERYFVMALVLWLFCTALYFLFSPKKNIKFIPVTLCLLAVLVAVGPFSAFQVSKHSQLNRLQQALKQNNLLVNGKIKPATERLPEKEVQNISSILHYLDNMHTFEEIKPWFAVDLDSVLAHRQDSLKAERIYDRNNTIAVMELMGLEYLPAGYAGNMLYFNRKYEQGPEVWDVQGYDYVMDYQLVVEDVRGAKPEIVTPQAGKYKLGTDSLTVKYKPVSDELSIAYLNDTLLVALEPFTQQLRELDVHELPQEKLTLTVQGQRFSMKIAFQHLALARRQKTFKLATASAQLFVKKKE